MDADFSGEPSELEGYTEVTGLVVVENSDASSLEGMECLRNVGVGLILRANPLLATTRGVGLERAGLLRVTDNPELADLSGLARLTAIEGRVTIRGNPKLETLSGLELLTSVGENLELMQNGILNVDGLQALESVGDTLQIATNANLGDLGGLASLGAVDELVVFDNDALSTFAGLEQLGEVGYRAAIVDNAALMDVTALADTQLSRVDGVVSIYDNRSLDACAANDLATRLQPPGWVGTTEVRDNLGVCP